MIFVQAEKPRRIIELGTALGYTACLLASATSETTVDTIELDEEHVALACANIEEAGLTKRVTVHEGDFRVVMNGLSGKYDLAFFDGFAPDNVTIGLLRGLLRDGGVLICANLSLSYGDHRRNLLREFDDDSRWSHIGALENGSTQVYRKIQKEVKEWAITLNCRPSLLALGHGVKACPAMEPCSATVWARPN